MTTKPSWWRQAWWWVTDYSYMLRGQLQRLGGPQAYARLRSRPGARGPVVLVPGIFEGKYFMLPLARSLHRRGYDAHLLPAGALALRIVDQQADAIADYVQSQNLHNVIIIGHSKGGLDGLAYLRRHAEQHRVRQVVAVAAPFNGTNLSHYVPLRAVRQFSPSGDVVRAVVESDAAVVRQVVCLSPFWDNHVWHPNGSFLRGATNVTVPVYGHHRVLFKAELAEIIDQQIRRLG
jgi:pimeloyl-ACP methyl ester carboxylesterase